MTIDSTQPGTASMIQRIKDILLRPRPTWEQIDSEPATILGLYKGYVLVLAAIGPVAGLIGGLTFGHGAFGAVFRPSLGAAVTGAVVAYILALVGVYLLALIIDALAPTFGGTRNRVQAFKVAVYGSTAFWLAGIFGLIPALAILGLLGLYSLYLIYLGLPPLMKAAKDKALPYTVVAIGAAVILWFIAAMLTTTIVAATAGTMGAMGGGAFTERASTRGTVTLPGGGRVDVSEMERAARAAEEAMNDPGSVQVIPAADLQGMMPAMAGAMPRTSISSSSGGMAGVAGSAAEAVYERDDSRIELTIADLGAMGGLAAMGGAFNVESNSESDGRYEKMGRVDGHMTTETYDRTSRSGEYSVLVGNRVLVAADGSNVSMEQLKSAVEAINVQRLEAMLGR